jgi:hypothetical protein
VSFARSFALAPLARGRTLGLALALVLGLAPRSEGGVIRVPVDFLDIANAFSASAPGDTIRLAGNGGSTYYTNETFDLEVVHDLVIEGGWRIDFTERDPDVFVSVLLDDTADYDTAVLRIDGSPNVVIDGLHLVGGRFGVLSESGANLTIRNCVIRNQRNLTSGGIRPGAAVRLVGGSLVLENSRIRSILAFDSGAGLAVLGSSSVTVRDCVIRSGTSRFEGGLLFARDVGTMVLENVTCENGGTTDAGGLAYVEGTDFEATNCVFRSGVSSTEGGAVALVACPGVRFVDTDFEGCSADRGGACHADDTPVSFENCRFAQNYARDSGGALLLDHSPFEIVGGELEANFNPQFGTVPDRGGAVYSIASDGTVTGTAFRDGRAVGRGGAWSQVGGDVVFTGCRFEDNESQLYGGGIQIELGGSVTIRDCLFRGNVAKFGGCLATSFTGRLIVEGSTLTGNSASSSGAAFFADTGGRIEVRDSILCCALRGDLVFCSSATTDFSHCDVWNDDSVNTRGEFGGSCVNPIGTAGNFSADPEFCDPVGSDDWLISATSPCAGAASDGGDIGWAGVGCAGPRPLQVEESTWGATKARYFSR